MFHFVNNLNGINLCKMKKTRRSPRLNLKHVEETKIQDLHNSPAGYIGMLPVELQFIILSYLDGICNIH